MVALKTFTFVSTLAGVALAHLQLQDPFPIKSPLNPAVGYQDKDYSYTAPLVSNGLPYPCKGYLDADASLRTSQKSWPAGSTQSFTIAPPGAIHGGGSCQLSLSYDMGKTWNVIWSYIGGCMAEDLTQSFAIPKEAPGGEAVFAWSWFNRQGNREMYHNCAVVTITNGGSGLNSRDYPAPFVANAGSVNSCSTIENIDPVFPNPGKTVKYSGGYKGQTPAGGQGITGSNCAHPGGADGAGTKASPGNAQQLVADPSSSAPASSASSSAHASSSSAVVNVVAPGATTSSSAAASSISLATSTTATPAASSTSSPTGAITASTAVSATARKCKRRRSVPKSLIPPAGVKAHKDRRIRRHAARATTHAELARRASSGRVAAQKAEKPVYAD